MKSLYELCNQYEAMLKRMNESQEERMKSLCLEILEAYTANVFEHYGVSRDGQNYELINTIFHKPHQREIYAGY